MSLIEIKKLSYSYPTLKDTLKNINLKINDGDFVCIVGENGSGKSTLIKCIVGLIKDYTGKIDIKERVGYLPQKTEIQNNFPASVEEIVLTGTIANGIKRIWYNKDDKHKANQVMKDLELYDIRKTCFGDLSGGQQQRVLTARALCATDKIIILDEPTNGLDPKIAKQIYEMLLKLNKKKGLTIVMVSHDIERSIKYCNRVIEIKKGTVTFDDEPLKYNVAGGAR